MPGVFDKIREKKAGWDKKQEEKKVAQIQKGIDGLFNDFKKHFEKKLGKMGLSFNYLTLSGANAAKREAGVIIGRFNDKEGYPITVLQTQHVYEGTPFGASFEKRIIYTGATLFGAIVEASIPFTLLFREVNKGFMKGKAKVFLPLTSTPFDEKKLLDDPRLQEPLVAALNADKRLVDATSSRLAISTVVSLTHKSTMTVSPSDIGGTCTIVPAGEETAIFLRTYGPVGYVDPKTVLEILSRIRRHILAHPHTEKITGKIPAAIFNTMYAMAKAKSVEPSKEAVL